MGNFNPNNDNQIVQAFYVYQGIEIHGGPVYWDGPNGPWVYICTNLPRAYAWVETSGTFNTTPISQDTTKVGEGYLSISANGGTQGTGILWISYSPDGTTGILGAYDASDLSKGQLWNSEMNSARDHLGYFAKFCPPTVANGKVYVATSSGALVVYGLLSTPVNQMANLRLAFVANNSTNELLLVSSSKGFSWSNNTPVNQASKATPALAVFQNRRYIAFVANNSSNGLLMCSSSDGVNWTNNTPANQASQFAPALAVY